MKRNKSIYSKSNKNGTGGALKQIFNAKKLNSDYYLVTLSDTPIFDYKILRNFIYKSISSKTDLSVLSQEVSDLMDTVE